MSPNTTTTTTSISDIIQDIITTSSNDDNSLAWQRWYDLLRRDDDDDGDDITSAMHFVKGAGGAVFDSAAQKHQFLQNFVQTQFSSSSPVNRQWKLLTLRLMLRETSALDVVLVPSVVDRVLFELTATASQEATSVCLDTMMEGLRCMINLLQRGGRVLRDHFTDRVVEDHRHHDHGKTNLYEDVMVCAEMQQQQRTDDAKWHSFEVLSHVSRLIFYNTFDPENCEKFVAHSHEIIARIFQEMNDAMQCIESASALPFFDQFLIDGLKFFYSVTHHMEKKQDEVLMAYFEEFMVFVNRAFQNYYRKKELLTEVCLRIVHVLMNLHENVLIVLLTEKSQGEERQRVLNAGALILLLSLFIENSDKRELVHSGTLQPVPVVLARAARHIPVVKEALQQWILHDQWPDNLPKPIIPEQFIQEFQEQDSVQRKKESEPTASSSTTEDSATSGQQETEHPEAAMAIEDENIDFPDPDNLHKRFFVRFLTEFNYELKSATSEFMFVLCDENPEQFIEQVGFGYAAGLLAERGLFGSLSG